MFSLLTNMQLYWIPVVPRIPHCLLLALPTGSSNTVQALKNPEGARNLGWLLSFFFRHHHMATSRLAGRIALDLLLHALSPPPPPSLLSPLCPSKLASSWGLALIGVDREHCFCSSDSISTGDLECFRLQTLSAHNKDSARTQRPFTL